MKQQWTKAKYYLTNFPIRLNFILLLALYYLAYLFLHQQSKENKDIDSYQPLVDILGKVALAVISTLIILSIFSTIVSYLLFLKSRHNKLSGFELNLKTNTEKGNDISIHPVLTNAQRPLLGYVVGRLILQNHQLSPAFQLNSSIYKKNSLITDKVFGNNALSFPDIKEYQVEGSIIYFEDMLKLFKLPIKQVIHSSFYKAPINTIGQETNIHPSSTEEMDVRIEQMRRVEGEWLHYKQFEYGDDVRRIVWKIYGKNRELIVRNPEIRNPYASDIEMYASFHNSLKTLIPDSEIAMHLLNTYKNSVWTLFKSLLKQKNWELNFVAEHAVANNIEDKEEQVAYQIAQSNWQETLGIEKYFDLNKGAVFCVHSLTSVDALHQFLDKGGSEQFIFMAHLSDAFKTERHHWLKRIFLINKEEDRANILSNSWLLSPLRLQMQKNEKRLNQLLKSYGFGS